MKYKLGAILLWVLVFVLGGITGAVSYNLYQQKVSAESQAKKFPKFQDFIDDMARFLNLDAQQKEVLTSIMEESVKRYKTLKKQYRAVQNETDDKIRAILRDDQKARYEEWLKKFLPKRQSSK
jgi:hypothetical protein